MLKRVVMKLIFPRCIICAAILPFTFSIKASFLLSSQLAPDNAARMHNLMSSTMPYPFTQVLPDGTLQQGITNRTVTHMLPTKTVPILKKMNLSILLPKANAFQTYASGSSVFPGYPDLSAKFDAMIATFKSNPEFIPFFRKVHINTLNELYHHLMSIYVNFSLQQTLIINHLVNIIESQFNGAIRSYAQNIPQTFATSVGKTMIQNDYSIDLSQFIMQQIEPQLIAHKAQYLKALAAYLNFFQSFTNYLHKPHPSKAQHFTAFVDIAEQINMFLYGDKTNDQDADTSAWTKMNPPLFYFSYDDIRALRIIPYLAKSIPATSQKIMWPEHIVDAADEGIVADGHPMAYFKTANQTVVHKNQGGNLYLCLQTGANLFEEQLLPQPDWLNSWAGVSKILAACFGDFSALLGLNILDPCMESLIENVVATQQGKDPNQSNTPSAACKAYLNQAAHEAKVPTTNTAPIATPDLLNASPGLQLPSSIPGLLPNLSNMVPSLTPSLSPDMSLSPQTLTPEIIPTLTATATTTLTSPQAVTSALVPIATPTTSQTSPLVESKV